MGNGWNRSHLLSVAAAAADVVVADSTAADAAAAAGVAAAAVAVQTSPQQHLSISQR